MMTEHNTRPPEAETLAAAAAHLRDIQSYGSTQAPDRADILNVGGFSDAVFKMISRFAQSGSGAQHWVDLINEQSI